MQNMMPYLSRKSDDVMVRLDVFYTELLRLKFGIGVDEEGQLLRPNDQQAALAREVFGDRVVDAAPAAWYASEGFLAAEKMPHEWEAAPIHSRAKWMAAKRIEGMIRGVERYRDVIERKNKEALAKLRNRRKGK